MQKISDDFKTKYFQRCINFDAVPKLLLSFMPGSMERTLVEILLEMSNGLDRICFFLVGVSAKPQGDLKSSFSRMLFV